MIQTFHAGMMTAVLSRLGVTPLDGSRYSRKQLYNVELKNGLNFHKIMRVIYTSYDRRRMVDIVRPDSRPNVILYSRDPNSKHPFLYAQVIKIIHVEARVSGSNAPFQRVDLLWVRWYLHNSGLNRPISGFSKRRLHKVYFPALSTQNAFGFIDPNSVLRGIHIIPDFNSGRKDVDYVGQTIGKSQFSDYRSFNVNQFVILAVYPNSSLTS